MTNVAQALQKKSGFSSLSESELEVIKKQFFPRGASNEEIGYCLSVAKHLDLNPLMKEIMFVPRRQYINGKWIEKYEPLVGRDGFLSIAHKTGQLAGIETVSFIKQVPRRTNNGWEYVDDLVARCTVYRKDTDKPFVVEVCFSEYAQRTKEGQLTAFWAEKPETMLKKVAESQCLRKAFNISGIYGAEEIGYGTYDADGMVIRDPEAEEAREYREYREKKEESEPEPQPQQSTEHPLYPHPQEVELLERMGLQCEVKDGWVGVKGSYTHRNLLEKMGFRWVKDKGVFVKKVS